MNKALLVFLLTFFNSTALLALDNVDELLIDDDPYIGVMIDFSEYSPMVSMSNVTQKLTPSKYVVNVDNLITSLAQSKTATKDLFKNEHKIIEFLPNDSKFKVKNILKTAIYKDNVPDEYTTYILEDAKGKVYAMPDFELKDVSRAKLNSYDNGLITKMQEQNNYARIVIYLAKPPLLKNKTAPFTQQELSPVFDYFLDQIKDYQKDTILMSDRNFRLSMNVTADTLAYLISEFNSLYIEDIEILSAPKKLIDQKNYTSSKIRYKNTNWYDSKN
jgi:hypothetical protein